jgi:hypothetical protein
MAPPDPKRQMLTSTACTGECTLAVVESLAHAQAPEGARLRALEVRERTDIGSSWRSSAAGGWAGRSGDQLERWRASSAWKER